LGLGLAGGYETNEGVKSIDSYLIFIKYNLFSKYLIVLAALIGAKVVVSSSSVIGSPTAPMSRIYLIEFSPSTNDKVPINSALGVNPTGTPVL
jgi:hypothetical protein